jgi:hypothetical protein
MNLRRTSAANAQMSTRKHAGIASTARGLVETNGTRFCAAREARRTVFGSPLHPPCGVCGKGTRVGATPGEPKSLDPGDGCAREDFPDPSVVPKGKGARGMELAGGTGEGGGDSSPRVDLACPNPPCLCGRTHFREHEGRGVARKDGGIPGNCSALDLFPRLGCRGPCVPASEDRRHDSIRVPPAPQPGF